MLEIKRTKDELNTVGQVDRVWCVLTHGTLMMLTLYVVNWDMMWKVRLLH